MGQGEEPGREKRKPDALVLCEGRDNLHGYTCREEGGRIVNNHALR